MPPCVWRKMCWPESLGANPESVIVTPYYPYSKGLDLGGATDLTLSAEGATLLCEGWMEPLCIENCTRVKVKGLTIDYKRKPFSSGEIVSVQPDCFDVQFAGERTITEEMPLTRMTIWNKEKNRMYPNPIYFPKRELLGGNRVFTPQKWVFRRKRLRPRLQTFARSVANVCGKGCKRLRLRRAKWAHKSIN